MLDGTPVAVQIVGRRHADDLVLSVGAALEEARPWRHWYQNLHLEELCSYPM
jgi:Asp-tRNA(Asn)/Glu-tRNA(Gln) amidotransferase A subunit family amidase